MVATKILWGIDMTNYPRFSRIFPDYDNGEIFRTTLARFERFGVSDLSWRNDTCPNMGNNHARLWIDYADPEMREQADMSQFCVTTYDDQEDMTSIREFDDIVDAMIYFRSAI